MNRDRADRVRREIARAALGDGIRDGPLGEFTLLAGQRESAARVRAAIAEFGGALLADAPGTGKTVVALAVARSYEGVVVVLPAAVRDQWTRALARAGRSARIVTLEALSRGACDARAPLVIVDEAHQARTPGARRYAALARLCTGAHVLLLSATPVVNRRSDRDALLALFLGARASALTRQESARVIVRGVPDARLRPAVERGEPLGGAPDVPGIAAALRALPPAFPARDGAPAHALVRITLALAWCSSLAALDGALRRRLQRGEALGEALGEGRWPDRAALRAWIVGEDGTQLAFTSLLAGLPVPDADLHAARSVLEAHLGAVRELRRLIGAHVDADTRRRAGAIRDVLRSRPSERAVVFARHADTVRALFRALRAAPGVAAIVGARVYAAAGRWTRREVLAALTAVGSAPSATDPRAVRLLLTTDLLSEGVDLAAVRTVVHADLPWTPARLEQRLGRITRVSSASGTVRELRFRLPRDARPFVRLAERLRDKREVRRVSLEAPTALGELRRLLGEWCGLHPEGIGEGEAVAAVEGGRAGFLASVLVGGPQGDRVRLLGGVLVGTTVRVSSDPRRLLRLARDAGGRGVRVPRRAEAAVRDAIAQWLASRGARALVGRLRSPARRRSRAGTLEAALAGRFARMLAAAPMVARAPIAELDRVLRRTLEEGVGVATETALWSALRTSGSDGELLERVRGALHPRASGPRDDPPPARMAPRHPGGDGRILALLLVTRAADPPRRAPTGAPPSASR